MSSEIPQSTQNRVRYKVAHLIAGEHIPLGLVYTSHGEAQRWADRCNTRHPHREAKVVPWEGDDCD